MALLRYRENQRHKKVNIIGRKEYVKFTAMTVLYVVGILLAYVALSFGVVAGLYWLICFAFGLTFSIKTSVGVWAIVLLLSVAFGTVKRG